MAAIALAGFLDSNGMPPNGIVLTAVLPGGCPFACPFCIVAARSERSTVPSLTPDHYSKLVTELAHQAPIGAVAIVGDEPLQEEAWPFAEALLGSAQELGLPVAMVTNGYNLIDFIDRLERFSELRVLVSIDGVGSDHDEIRRKTGAFERIVAGIAEMVARPHLRKNLSVATTMLPRNIPELPRILQLVSRLGVPRMVVSPLLSSSRGAPVRMREKGLEQAARTIPTLLAMPEARTVSLHVADEFGLLGRWESLLKAEGVDVMRPRRPPELVRVDALGQVETLHTIRDGGTTGVRLPENRDDISVVIGHLLSEHFSALKQAA